MVVVVLLVVVVMEAGVVGLDPLGRRMRLRLEAGSRRTINASIAQWTTDCRGLKRMLPWLVGTLFPLLCR